MVLDPGDDHCSRDKYERLQSLAPMMLIGDFGEPGGPFQPTLLARLEANRCSAKVCGHTPGSGTSVQMWIGAIGPCGAEVQGTSEHGTDLLFPRPFG